MINVNYKRTVLVVGLHRIMTKLGHMDMKAKDVSMHLMLSDVSLGLLQEDNPQSQ